MGPQKGMHPPFSFVLPKENAPCTVEKKSASSKLARAGKFGDATVESHGRIKPVRAHPSALYLGNHPAFKPQVVAWFPTRGACRHALLLFPLPLRWGCFQRGGRSPSLCRVKGRSRRGRPKSPSWRVFWTVHGPFSPRGENGGRICPPPSRCHFRTSLRPTR